jgi:SprT protein
MASTAHRPDLAELKRRAEARTRELLARAARHYGVSMPDPIVAFDLRGRAAGKALAGDARRALVRYNAALLAAYPEHFIAHTVPHEVAHLVVFRVFGRMRPHGPEWASVMAFFGVRPERCHNYDVSGLATRRLRRYPYRCACRDHQLTSIRHNRIRGGQVYLCTHCGVALRPAAPPEPNGP